MSEENKYEERGGGNESAATLKEELNTGRNLISELSNDPPRPVPVLEKKSNGDENVPKIGKKDYLGREFDSKIHVVDSGGNPVLTSGGTLKIKKEAKRNVFKKVKDFFSGQPEEESKRIDYEPEIPLSDDEFRRQMKKEEEQARNLEEQQADVVASARNSAELYFFGGMMAFGPGFLTHKERFLPSVAYQFSEYERRTGRRIDLPPGMALAVGLGSISWQIVKADPECKKRFDRMTDAVRENIAENWVERIPFLRMFTKQETEKGGDNVA